MLILVVVDFGRGHQEDSTPADGPLSGETLIDGEVVCCDERGMAAFHVLRRRRWSWPEPLYSPP